jgi:hypothetical protein
LSTVTIAETRPATQEAAFAVMYFGGYPRTDPDRDAIMAAVAELGITEPVEVRPFISPPPLEQLRSEGLPEPSEVLPLGATTWDSGRWVIYIDTTLGDDDPTAGPSFSHTLWHELGHAQDLSQRARESGRPIEAVLYDDAEARTKANRAIGEAGWDRASYEAAHAEYVELDEEKYAEAVAAAHHHKRLSLTREEA